MKYVCSEECNRALSQIKAMLVSVPVLAAPNFTKPSTMAVYASDVSNGAVLLQNCNDNLELPVAFFSHKLNSHQRNYATIEQRRWHY